MIFRGIIKNNYLKIETKYIDYLYGFVNIRNRENKNIPIIGILNLIAKNTMHKQLIEFLMENKRNSDILLSITQNMNKDNNDSHIIDLKIIRRILEYAISPNDTFTLNDTFIVENILLRKEISSEIIKRVVLKFDGKFIKEILLNTSYFDEKINKWINNKFGNYEKKKDIDKTKLITKHIIETKENDDILRELLIELRDDEIKKEFKIDERCILSNIMIEKIILSKPTNIEEFRENIPNKDVDINQVKYLDKIFEIIEMADE